MQNQSPPWNWDAVSEANRNLDKRLSSEGIELFYDSEEDTLFVTIGVDDGAITEHVLDTIYVRIDPETNFIVGYALLEFVSHLLAENGLLRQGFESIYDKLINAEEPVRWQGQPAARAHTLLKGLLPVAAD